MVARIGGDPIFKGLLKELMLVLLQFGVLTLKRFSELARFIE